MRVSFAAIILFTLSILPVGRAAEPVTITVEPGARQTFGGFGASQANWHHGGLAYQKLHRADQLKLSGLVWRDLNLRVQRVWLDLDVYAPTEAGRDPSQFVSRYVTSRIVADAAARGATVLELAPERLPKHLREPVGNGDFKLKAGAEGAYAELIADFITRMKSEHGLEFVVTGLQNELNDRNRLTAAQVVAVVKALRRDLDARGLKSVGILAPELASADGVLYDMLDALRADPAAWGDLRGVAWHSYNMAATPELEKRIGPKEAWMTEASANGPASPDDLLAGASTAARVLNDVNHGCTHWVWFIGFDEADAVDDQTRLVRFTMNPFKAEPLQPYWTLRQLSAAFPPGSVFRKCGSSAEGEMTFTYGRKPRLTAAAAELKGGAWSVGLANFTSDLFSDESATRPFVDTAWARGQGGAAAAAFDVTVKIAELAASGERTVHLRRSAAGAADRDGGTAAARGGVFTVRVDPLEVVTARIAAP